MQDDLRLFPRIPASIFYVQIAFVVNQMFYSSSVISSNFSYLISIVSLIVSLEFTWLRLFPPI